MRLWPIIILSSVSCTIFAQGEIDKQDKTFWRNEKSFGATVYSNAWEVKFGEYRQTEPEKRLFIEFGLGGYKDPKEVKIQNSYYYSPYSFVYGKLNMNWHLNAGFGYQHEIFEKKDLGGVSIGWNITGGPVLTFCKPIYYKVITGISGQSLVFEEKKFDITTMLYENIYSKASVFKGLDEIKLFPGMYARGGFNFEYGKSNKVSQTIEVGSSVSAYLKEIPIMASGHNKQVFFALYASYKVGFILDPVKMEHDFLTKLFTRKKE